MVHADLHVHTAASDGTLTVADLPAAARRAGVAVVGVTDHERVHPDVPDTQVRREGVLVLRGVELRVEAADGQRVDLLGYGVARTRALEELVETVQADRVDRAAAIRERLEARLGVALEVDLKRGVGRPHLARAVVEHPATEYAAVGDVFRDLIGEDGPCYVERPVPAFERGRAVLADAAGVVGLAHPLRYDDPSAALELAADLDAVERYYPYDDAVDPAPVERAVERHGLLATGGSDAHGATLGAAGLDRDGWERLREPLGLG